MIDKFLKAKHWQLFILTFGIPMIFQIITMIIMTTNIAGSKSEALMIFDYMKLYSILMIIFIGVFFGWFWSVAVGLQSKIPNNIKMNVKTFKFFFFIPLVYILFILIFMDSIMSGLIHGNDDPNIRQMVWAAGLIVPIHLFSMFCIFYSLYFVAKTYKTVELKREVNFSDFAGDFFLIWLYPIGIWIIQPKINKMVE